MVNVEWVAVAVGAIAVAAVVFASRGRRRVIAVVAVVALVASTSFLLRSTRLRAEHANAKIARHCDLVTRGFPTSTETAVQFGIEGIRDMLRRSTDVDHFGREVSLCLGDPSLEQERRCEFAVRYAAHSSTLDEFPGLMAAMMRAFDTADPRHCPEVTGSAPTTPP